MKFVQFIKGAFTRNIPLKILALLLGIFCVIVINAATGV